MVGRPQLRPARGMHNRAVSLRVVLPIIVPHFDMEICHQVTHLVWMQGVEAPGHLSLAVEGKRWHWKGLPIG
jgi:hypothetical protein